MLELVTGQPGNAKTLFAVSMVERRRLAENRPVFYFGIKPKEGGPIAEHWTALERGEDWYKCPEGAIVLIDEAQKVFRPRSQASQPPVHVSAFETHRHDALDIVIITQHPTFVDAHVRKCAGRHHHLVRRFGFLASTRYQWEEERDVKSDAARADALKKTFKFPREVYGWYHSAKGHTVRRDFPLSKVAVLVAGMALFAVSAGYAWHHVRSGLGSAFVHGGAVKSEVTIAGENDSQAGRSRPRGGPWDASLHGDRLAGLQASKPFYDELIKAVTFPKVAGCMRLVFGDGHVECTCTSQQGTVLDMTTRQCGEFLRRGWFDFTDGSDYYAVGRAMLPSAPKESSVTREAVGPVARVGS